MTFSEEFDSDIGLHRESWDRDVEWVGIDTTPDGYKATASGLFVPAHLLKPKVPVGLDLFAGCGGFSLGMQMAGFDVVAALEWDVNAFLTYVTNLGSRVAGKVAYSEGKREELQKLIARTNKKRAKAKELLVGEPEIGEPGWWGWHRERSSRAGADGCRAFFLGDIQECSGETMMDLAGVDEFDVIFGGPPCQGLSTSNSKACIEDPRNAMLWEFLRFVEEVKPKSFIIENVPQLLTAGKGHLFRALRNRAVDLGYRVVAEVVDACNYGVPQRRRRALVVGYQGDHHFQFPMPTTWAIGMEPGGKAWDFTQHDDEPLDVEFDETTKRWKQVAESHNANESEREQTSLFAEADE